MFQHYDVQEKLGAGAGGTVYRAFDTHLHRPVVIKLLHRSDASVDHTARLMEEARLASAIEHPNVCAVYEAGEVDGQPYLVMQYVPGRTLLELIEGDALAQTFTLSVGVQIASGLAAAHRTGILHRDLKPANIMITDEGLAKILDFGLARRISSDADLAALEAATRPAAPMSSRFGTTAYMAPEQFVTRRSTEQSDLWALGVILYQMATGQHPFWVPSGDAALLVRAIQLQTPPDPQAARPDLAPGFAEVLAKALAKQPDARYQHATELRDALKTLLKTLDPEAQAVPGEAALPAPLAEEAPSRNGVFSKLADRLLPPRPPELADHAVAVLPFEDYGSDPSPAFYGFALADAIATRLAHVSALLVRPPWRFRAAKDAAADPSEVGRRAGVAHVLTGQFARTADGFHLTWTLLDVRRDAVEASQSTEIASTDLVAVQHQFGEEVYARLHASGVLPMTAPPRLRPAEAVREAALPDDVAEDYLSARALLNSQATRSSHQADLERARRTFEQVLAQAPDFAPAHASLGMALTRYVRLGFGGASHLLAAQRHLDRALDLDPSNIEAKLYRAYTLLGQGQKEHARNDILYLLQAAAYDAEVHVGAGVALLLDGLLDEALGAFGTALQINPTQGPRVYNFRARVYLYQQRPEPARREIEKGLALEPQHTLLRTTHGVWHLRHGALPEALALLEGVRRDDPHLRLAHPALAIAYHRDGQPERAAALVDDALLDVAAADGEMAYRVATYFAETAQGEAALEWLRKTIYLGNHNVPWFRRNPSWEAVRDREDIQRTLADLAQMHDQHRARWTRVGLPARA